MAKHKRKPSKAVFRVPVGSTTYRVKGRANIKQLGLTKFNPKKILISKDLDDAGQWAATFWHEWMHAVTFEGGYNKINDNEAFIEYMGQSIKRWFTDPVGRMILAKMLDQLEPK